MNNNTLDEREFELINVVGMRLSSNQRELSKHMDLSLGMTNMLIGRLIAKGYIRIEQLNKKKVEYLLTPKGFSEKMRKSVKYTLKTINSIGLIKNRLREIILELQKQGKKEFYIVGDSDLAVIVDMTIREIFAADCKITHIPDPTQAQKEGLILICKEGFDHYPSATGGHMNLILELAKSPELASQNMS